MPVEHATPLMVPLIGRVADEIAESMVTGSSREERLLLAAFQRIERRGVCRPVFAINDRILISNASASGLVCSDQHATLWTQVTRGMESGASRVAVSLGCGATRTAILTPVLAESDVVGAIVQFSGDRARGDSKPTPEGRKRRPSLRADSPLARLGGHSVQWQSAVQRSRAVAARGGNLLLVGEAGVGKRTLARALHEDLGHRFTEVDLAKVAGRRALDATRSALDTRQVILLQLERLAVRSLGVLGDLLRAMKSSGGEQYVRLGPQVYAT